MIGFRGFLKFILGSSSFNPYLNEILKLKFLSFSNFEINTFNPFFPCFFIIKSYEIFQVDEITGIEGFIFFNAICSFLALALFEAVNALCGTLTELCTPVSCPVMCYPGVPYVFRSFFYNFCDWHIQASGHFLLRKWYRRGKGPKNYKIIDQVN